MTAQALKNYFRATLVAQRSIAQEYSTLDAIVDFIVQGVTSGIQAWTGALTFNTDGTGAGGFCTYTDTANNLRFWKTKTDGNINHQPPTNPSINEDSFWKEVSPSDGSAIKEWAAGIYPAGLVIVYYDLSGTGADPALYVLLDPTRPFTSSNLSTETTAGKWKRIGLSSAFVTSILDTDFSALSDNLTDASTILWDCKNRRDGRTYLSSAQTAINLTMKNLLRGGRQTLVVFKQNAPDLTIRFLRTYFTTASLYDANTGDTLNGAFQDYLNPLSGPAGTIFEIEINSFYNDDSPTINPIILFRYTTRDKTLSQVLTAGNDAGAHQIKNIADPTSAQDAVSKIYADTYLGAHALPSLSAGFLKYSGSAWTFDSASYLPMSGGTLTGPLTLSGDGSAALHPVSFQQFSNALQGLQPKPTARAKTTGALAANTYANGTSGVGATLTGNSNGALAAQDGVSLSVGDVLFVTNEATSANNGLYTVTQLGDGSHPYILTRSVDMDASSEFNGSFIIVDNEGTANKNTLWIFNYVGGFATGTSSVTFTNLNPATSYLPGSGLSLSGVTFSIAAGGVTNSMIANSTIDLTAKVTGILPIANGGTNASSASITAFNNITGYTASGATGTTSTNLVFSGSPAFTGTPTLGTLGYSDTGILFSLQSSTNSYNQLVIQNTNSGASASSSFIINNNNSTASAYFGEFGINSGAFTGSGSLNLANAIYLTSTTGDLVLGTTTNNTFRVVTNNSTTDRFSIDGNGVFTFNAPTQGNLFKASANIDFWQMQNSSGTVLGLENSSDAVKTLCTGSGTGSSTTITVTSTTGFASSGLAMLDNFEIFSYTGITSNSLTGCTRGLYGTTAISWNSSDAVANIPLFRGTSSTNISYFIYKSLSNNKTVMNFQNAWWRGDSYVSDGSLFVTKLNGGTGNIYFSSSSLSGSSAVASIGGGSNQINIGGINSLAITQYNVANASDLRLFSITDAAFSTARTASTELTMMDINISSVQQLSTGSLTLQRFTRWRQPGLKFVGASAVTDMANFEIDGAAIAGDNNTTTNTHGLLIKSVLSVVTGTGAATNAFGATINAPTGATNNFAAQFVGNTTKFIGLGSSTQKLIDAYQSDGTTNVLFLKDNGDFQVGLSSSKFGVLGAPAISKVTTSISAASFVANSSGISNDSATWGGYTVGQAIQAMINYGFLT